MNRGLLMLLTALVEGAVGICLLLFPAVLFYLLLGLTQSAPETTFVGRIAGAALLAIGIASWLTRRDASTSGLLAGVLVYNATVAILLLYAGTILKMAGIMLWPTVALHAALAAWCLICLRRRGLADR
jgi:hypothetical protein